MLSDNIDDKEIVQRYWAKDAKGNFLETVSGLLPYKGISQVHEFVKFLTEVSIATDLNQLCSQCDEHVTLTSRSMAIAGRRHTNCICRSCSESNKAERLREEEDSAERLRSTLSNLEEQNLKKQADYTTISFDLVLLLIALERSISPRLINGHFNIRDCATLASRDRQKLVRRLASGGLIVDIPSKSPLGAYYLKNDELWHQTDRVAYALVPDMKEGRSHEAFSILTAREPDDGKDVYNLWLDYSTADCLGYLEQQCASYGLALGTEAEKQISSSIRSSLPHYSPAQLWSACWKIAKDAAALSTRSYYTKQSAADTIPGKFKRHLEEVERNDYVLKDWTRPNNYPAGTLGDVFYDYFGITESTPSGSVADRIYELCTAIPQNKRCELPVQMHASSVMKGALLHGISKEVMNSFAEYVRAGMSNEAAMSSLIEQYPVLTSGLIPRVEPEHTDNLSLNKTDQTGS